MRTPLLTSDRALVIHLLLALSLLLAQAAAQAHVYSHLNSGRTSTSDFTGAASQICGECLASTPLLSAAGAADSPRIAFVPDVAGVVASSAVPCVPSSPTHAFRSRAPPALR